MPYPTLAGSTPRVCAILGGIVSRQVQPESSQPFAQSGTHALVSGASHVFISYSHESEAHRAYCLELAQRLREAGIDAWIDQFETSPELGWPRWMQQQLEGATHTILVCTDHYKRRFEGNDPGQGQGVNWEGFLTQQMLYDDDARNRRFIPVLRDGEPKDVVPRALRSATYYYLPSGFDSLVQRLTRPPTAPFPVTLVRPRLPSGSNGTKSSLSFTSYASA